MERPDQIVVEPADRSQVLHQRHDLELGRSRVVGDDRQITDQVSVGHLQQQLVVLLAAHHREEGGRCAGREVHGLRPHSMAIRVCGLQSKCLGHDEPGREQRLDPQRPMSAPAVNSRRDTSPRAVFTSTTSTIGSRSSSSGKSVRLGMVTPNSEYLDRSDAEVAFADVEFAFGDVEGGEAGGRISCR